MDRTPTIETESRAADVIVVGAGVSGLACAYVLTEAGLSVRVIEALERPGGRIQSVLDSQTGRYVADLGPTWIWPAYQPVIKEWIQKLDLESFPQFDKGLTAFDQSLDRPAVMQFAPGQDGNRRVVGGSQALVDALVARLPEGVLEIGTPVSRIAIDADRVSVSTVGDLGRTHHAERVVLAVPPRIALTGIDWAPNLSAPLAQALGRMPTWMATHAKVVVVYEMPFWRAKGYSGRIASSVGPIVEGHDHSGQDGSPAALFGFIGWPYEMRAELGAEMEGHVRTQLRRCFGADSPEPLSVHIEDWATNPYVTTQADLASPMMHPDVGPDVLRAWHFNDRVVFSVAEVARRSPGLIEGAFDAAQNAADSILRLWSQLSRRVK